MLLKTVLRAADLVRQLVLPARWPGVRRYLRRLLLLALLPLFLLLQLFNLAGCLLDELLFPGYRRVEVRRPLFILGVPRSGTTYLHRLLAADPRFTSLSLWECLFAPSISQRYLVSAIGSLDRVVGSPLRRLLGWLERTLLGSLDDIHPVTLEAAEEDYLLLLPILCCFVLVVPFPEADWVWRMGRFDRDVEPAERRRILRWYRRCLQRHLYFHGTDRILLSKNASFAGMAQSLTETFPDCILAICQRDARQVIGSQFNSLADALRLFGVRPDDPAFSGRLVDCLHFYYQNLERIGSRLGNERAVPVNARALARDPRAVIGGLYSRLGIEPGSSLEPSLQRAEARGAHRPLRQPPLAHWGLDEALIARRFSPWCRQDARL